MKSIKQKLITAQNNGVLKLTVEGYKRTLRSDQKLDVAFLCLNKRALLAAPIGCGKTISAVGALKKLHTLKAVSNFLVVASGTVSDQWVEEINYYAGLKVTNLDLPAKERTSLLERGGNFITTPKAFQVDLELHLRQRYDAIILDESVLVKNPGTAAWDAMRQLSAKANFVFFLSGEPLENAWEEIYGQLECLVPGLIGSYEHFLQRFCIITKLQFRGSRSALEIPKITGYKNVDEFKALVDPYILYRVREDIPELNISLRKVVFKLELTPEQRQIYSQLESQKAKEDPRSKGDVFKWQGILLRAANSATFYGGSSSSKLDKLKELFQHPFIRERQVLIYTRCHEMVGLIVSSLREMGVQTERYTGKESQKRRVALKDGLNKKQIDALVVTDAGVRGPRLEATSVVIFMERPFSPKAAEQIIGRSARVGQKAPFVTVIVLIAKGTKDEYVTTVLNRKQNFNKSFYDKDNAMYAIQYKSLDDLVENKGGKRVLAWK